MRKKNLNKYESEAFDKLVKFIIVLLYIYRTTRSWIVSILNHLLDTI